MAVNTDLVLAAIAGAGGDPSIAFFAPLGSTAPTDASTALDAAYLDLGWCSTDGMVQTTETESETIEAFGAFSPVRTIISSETRTFACTALETNVVSLAIKSRLPLTGADAPTVDTLTGTVDTVDGPSRSVRYQAVFDFTDGLNVIRKVMPSLEVTEIGDESYSKAGSIQYPFTFTAYPDENNVSVKTFYVLNALIA